MNDEVIEKLLELRFLTNRHTIQSGLSFNNTNNEQYFQAALEGEADSPGLQYLLNLDNLTLKDQRSISTYNELKLAVYIAQHRELEEIQDGFTVQLPKPKASKIRLIDAIEERRSTRFFADEPLSLRDFSSWLQYGIGLGVRERAERELSYPSRVYASGGGFYSVTSWLVINNVEGIENGFYKYQPYTHTLYPQKTAEYDFSEILAGSFDFEHAGGVILYGLELDRAFVKYGDLIVLLGLVEVGNMTHSLELAGSGWGIGSCQVGGFNKGYVERMLNFDGLNQHVVFSQIFGKRRG